ncbi:hypothetical protein J6590_073718 [Homalodisca vitripennis]|nr:hypothetical protein J6590_073718 [Homalodisca vitripennis]
MCCWTFQRRCFLQRSIDLGGESYDHNKHRGCHGDRSNNLTSLSDAIYHSACTLATRRFSNAAFNVILRDQNDLRCGIVQGIQRLRRSKGQKDVRSLNRRVEEHREQGDPPPRDAKEAVRSGGFQNVPEGRATQGPGRFERGRPNELQLLVGEKNPEAEEL